MHHTKHNYSFKNNKIKDQKEFNFQEIKSQNHAWFIERFVKKISYRPMDWERSYTHRITISLQTKVEFHVIPTLNCVHASITTKCITTSNTDDIFIISK